MYSELVQVRARAYEEGYELLMERDSLIWRQDCSHIPNQDSETIKNSKGSVNVSECKKICPAAVIFSYAENGMVNELSLIHI